MNKNQGSLLTSIYTIIALGITMIFFFPLWWSFSNSLRIPKETFTVTGCLLYTSDAPDEG